MAIIANLLIKLGIDTKDVGAGLDKATRDVKRFGSELESAGLRLTAGISLPLIGVGAAALDAAGKMEQNRVAFTTLLKSADAAKAHLADLQKFALVTPFQFDELTKASRLMQAYGFSAQDVVPKLRTIGNAVSALGGGSDVLERVVRSMGEIGTRGKITGEQLRELSRAGIPALQAIADKLGVSVTEAQDKITKGMVDAKTASDALYAYMDKRFAGGMESQSKTILGMWSNIKDKLTFTLVAIGDALIPWAKSFVSDTLDPMLGKIKDLAEGFGKLPKPLQDIALGGTAATVAFPLLTVAIGATITNSIVIAGAIGKLLPVLAGLSTFISGTVIGTLTAMATWLGTLSLAAGAAASLGLAALIVGVYKLVDAYSDLKAAQAGEAAQEQQRLAALSKLESSMRQQGIDFEYLRKQYDAGNISIDTYVSLLRDLTVEHRKSAGAVKTSADTQAKYNEALLAAEKALGINLKGNEELAKAVFTVYRAYKDGVVSLNVYTLALEKYGNAVEKINKNRPEVFNPNPLPTQSNNYTPSPAFDIASLAIGGTELERFSQRLTDLKLGWDPMATSATKSLELVNSAVLESLSGTQEWLDYINRNQAFEFFHVKSAAELQKLAEESRVWFGVITSGLEDIGTAGMSAFLQLTDAENEAAHANQNISDEVYRMNKVMLDVARKETEGKKGEVLNQVRDRYELSRQTEQMAHHTFDSLERGLAKNIVTLKGWAATGKGIVTTLAEDMLSIMLKGFLKPLEDQFAKLATKIGKWLDGIWGKGGSAPGIPSPGGSTPSVPGGSPGGAAGGAASGLTGTITMVSGIATAISSVVGNFQMAGMNKSLDLIVKHTLQTANDMFNLRRDLWDQHNGLRAIQNMIYDRMGDMWATMRDGGTGGGGKGGITFNSCSFTGSPQQIADAIFTQAQLAGAL